MKEQYGFLNISVLNVPFHGFTSNIAPVIHTPAISILVNVDTIIPMAVSPSESNGMTKKLSPNPTTIRSKTESVDITA